MITLRSAISTSWYNQGIRGSTPLSKCISVLPSMVVTLILGAHRQIHSSHALPLHRRRSTVCQNPAMRIGMKGLSHQALSQKQCIFPPTSQKMASVPGVFPTEKLQEEQGLFGCDMDYALMHGGEITRTLLQEFLKIPYVMKVYKGEVPGYQIIIDVKMHQLQKGEIPSTPGWHTDFAENGLDGEPDYNKIIPEVTTYIVNFSDHSHGVSNTEYALTAVSLNLPERNIYASIDKQMREKTDLKTGHLRDGEIFNMDQRALHRGVPAHNAGLRGFIRVSILHDFPFLLNIKASTSQPHKPNAPHNRIREKTQSYVKFHPNFSYDGRMHLWGNDAQLLNSSSEVKFCHSFNDEGLQCVFTESEIRQEPIIINGSWAYAEENGGEITQKFLKTMKHHPLIDSLLKSQFVDRIKVSVRIHMLMKGQYPDIPEWRSGIPFEKTIHPNTQGDYFLLLLGNKKDCISEIELDDKGTPIRTQNGKIIHTSEGIRHRVLPAHESGWRVMLMLNINDRPAENKTTKQSRVYLDDQSILCSCTVGANNEQKISFVNQGVFIKKI